MKPRNTFNSKGKVYLASSLHKAAKDLPIEDLVIPDDFTKEKLYWSLNNMNDFINHVRRMEECNLSSPLIFRSDGQLMDGNHRIVKAIMLGRKTLPSQHFVTDPEPDWQE